MKFLSTINNYHKRQTGSIQRNSIISNQEMSGSSIRHSARQTYVGAKKNEVDENTKEIKRMTKRQCSKWKLLQNRTLAKNIGAFRGQYKR